MLRSTVNSSQTKYLHLSCTLRNCSIMIRLCTRLRGFPLRKRCRWMQMLNLEVINVRYKVQKIIILLHFYCKFVIQNLRIIFVTQMTMREIFLKYH